MALSKIEKSTSLETDATNLVLLNTVTTTDATKYIDFDSTYITSTYNKYFSTLELLNQ